MCYNRHMEKYKRIYEDLYYAIKSGKFSNGDLLPKEEELCQKYQVSRITVRHALDLLKSKGLVKRKKRLGTVVDTNDFSSKQTNGFIAVVFTHFQNCANRIYHGLRELADKNKANLSFFDSEGSAEKEREILSFLLAQNVLGLILMPIGPVTNMDIISQFRIQKIPLAFMDFSITGIRAPLVTSDNFRGAYSLTEYLIRQGHRNIAYFPYTDAFLSTEEKRFKGYIEALIDNAIAPNPDYFITVKSNPSGSTKVFSADSKDAENAIELISKMPVRPTAVVCVNDIHAYALSDAAENLGLKIPDDLSITGFDNLSASINENITTVGQNFGEIARNALLALFRQLENGSAADNYTVKIPAVLIERGSVKPVVNISYED